MADDLEKDFKDDSDPNVVFSLAEYIAEKDPAAAKVLMEAILPRVEDHEVYDSILLWLDHWKSENGGSVDGPHRGS
jgi:hypothetical protein